MGNTVDYEKNLKTCGTPDCSSTCMFDPIFNEGSDYHGCWNQTVRGNKCIIGPTLNLLSLATTTHAETQTTKDKPGASLKIHLYLKILMIGNTVSKSEEPLRDYCTLKMLYFYNNLILKN